MDSTPFRLGYDILVVQCIYNNPAITPSKAAHISMKCHHIPLSPDTLAVPTLPALNGTIHSKTKKQPLQKLQQLPLAVFQG
jgi:hypothetical protein